MERKLCFASDDAYIDIPSDLVPVFLENGQSPELMEWADNAAERLNTLSSGIVFRIGKLRLTIEASRSLAHAIAAVICKSLQRSGAPVNMTVEIDRLQKTPVVTNYQVRTLLPHHDGGHCSYLSPSLKDDTSWTASLRRFSSEGYTTTQAHKLYQGIFITDPGEGLSITTYYDMLRMMSRAYSYATGTSDQPVERVATWLGNSIKASLALQSQHKSRYLTLGAALGGQKLVYHGIAVLYAEARFTDEQIERFPELEEYNRDGQSQVPPVERFMSQITLDTMGLTWDEFREEYEICLPSERFDFVLGHNLTLLHGGLMGGKRRLLEPICMVVDSPVGEEYENWLAQAWRSRGNGNH